MWEIATNPVSADNILLLPPTPAIDTQIEAVLLDDRVFSASIKPRYSRDGKKRLSP